MKRLLCRLGLHRWRRLPDSLGTYGMGLEWFENWECAHCPRTFDQLRAPPAWKPQDGSPRSPQYGWKTLSTGKDAS